MKINFSLRAHVALLIDADNVPLSDYAQILKIAEYYGRLEICKAFRNWKKLTASQIKIVDDLKIERIQVDQIGANATDYALSKGIGEILRDDIYNDHQLDTFIIVSGDGGFTMNCHLLQGNDKKVIGIGLKGSTSKILQKSCDEYHHREELSDKLSKLENRYLIPPSEVRKFYQTFVFACAVLRTPKKSWEIEDWIAYDEIEQKINEINSNFQENFGQYTLPQWISCVVNSIDSGFEISKKKVRHKIILSMAHHALMVTIWLKNPQPEHDRRVLLTEIYAEIEQLCPDYENIFASKPLAEWLEASYFFKIEGAYLVRR